MHKNNPNSIPPAPTFTQKDVLTRNEKETLFRLDPIGNEKREKLREQKLQSWQQARFLLATFPIKISPEITTVTFPKDGEWNFIGTAFLSIEDILQYRQELYEYWFMKIMPAELLERILQQERTKEVKDHIESINIAIDTYRICRGEIVEEPKTYRFVSFEKLN